MDIIQEFLSRNRQTSKTIYCIGDAMMDEYHEVKVDRISPEWPIPVMKSTGQLPVSVPGGVANVACQFRHFNAHARLISFCDWQNSLDGYGLDRDGCLSLELGGRIPVKQRFVEKGIQVAPRLDIERPLYGLEKTMLDAFAQTQFNSIQDWENPDVAILSDYNKGFFSSHIQDIEAPKRWLMRFRNTNTITIVDPKKGPAELWAGCKVFKPNAQEAAEMTGTNDPVMQITLLASKLPGSKIVITRGNEGLSVWDNGEYFEYKSVRNTKVESVVGAGDCFVAILGLALSHGHPLRQSVEIAHRAGEVYVQNRLNRPIIPAEMSTTKIVDPTDLAKRDFKLVFTNGCMDIIHEGHLSTLDYAKSKGDKLVVALNSDESVRRLKGGSRPFNDLEKRARMIARLDMVDFVVSFEEDTPFEVIRRCSPDAIVKGGDYRAQDVVGYDLVPEVCIAPYHEGFSTTSIIEKIKEKYK